MFPTVIRGAVISLFDTDTETITHFDLTTEEEIQNVVSKASAATCHLDPIPPALINDNIVC